MVSFDELATNESIKEEYKKTFLLNVFKKIVIRMKNDPDYKRHVRQLFKESTNTTLTATAIVRNCLKYELAQVDAVLMCEWLTAFLRKSDRRKPFTDDFKKSLYDKQNGVCAVCGELLGEDFSKIHVDHIIPWTLVGDELKDNYQYLCSFCNESKSCHTDFIFKSLLKLN